MLDYNTPTAVANQAIDAAGLKFTLGDIEEGTEPAQVCLRHYSECLRQLLRAAHWDFARREAPLVLLADATGQTTGVGTQVPGGRFIYEYAYPTNCAKVRYIPWNPFSAVAIPSTNIVAADSGAPLTTGTGQAPNIGQRVIPAPWMLTNDFNYIPQGANNDAQGISPTGRVVILTNVQYAKCVYTFEALYPSLWDHQFRAAMVAFLASEIAMPLATDKKFGLTMRDRNVALAQEKIKQARITDGNESWSSSDLTVDWMRARNSGTSYGAWGGVGWGAGLGGGAGLIGGWDAVSFSGNSSAY